MTSIENIEELKEKIAKSEVVSFDLFDTLLLRNVIHPTDIFKVVEFEYNDKNNLKLEFYKIRILAEKLARNHSKNEDVTLDEIYEFVKKRVGSAANELKQLEIEAEINFIIANNDMKEIYDYARSLQKKIYFITDMYLPSAVIKSILNRNGFENDYCLFVSCELNASKATGSIYAYIREKEGLIEGVEWLHIGDNYQSDIINAERANISGYYYKKLSDRGSNVTTDSLGESIIKAIQLNQKYIRGSKDYWSRFGAEIASSIYIGLMLWLEKNVREKDNIFFLARDGYFPFKLYQIMREHDPTLPEGIYLYASRRAYVLPWTVLVDKDKTIDTLTRYNKHFNQILSIRDILLSLGLDAEEYENVVLQFGISSCDVAIDESNEKRIKQFLHSIWKDIEFVLRRELDILKEYLDVSGLNQYEEINVFDVGWSGSTQSALTGILNKRVNGYYFGTLESMENEVSRNSMGYAFNLGTPIKRRNFIIKNAMMYEFLFSAPEGSLIHFERDEAKGIKPILSKVEQTDYVYECISKFQEATLKIFRQAMKYKKYLFTFSQDRALWGMEKLINSYNVTDLIEFSRLRNSVGMGYSFLNQSYVSFVKLDDYLNDQKYYLKQSTANLWNGAILILDNQDRYLNHIEVSRLYKTSRISFISGKMTDIVLLFQKVINDPRKAVKRLLILLKNLYSK